MTTDPRQHVTTTEPELFRGYAGLPGGLTEDELSEAGGRCDMCGEQAGPQDLDDDPDIPCWDCQQEMREAVRPID